MAFPTTLDELRAAGYKFSGGANCKACGAAIEWWETPNNKKIPMNHGTADPHWASCPSAKDFRRPKVGRSDHETNTE